MSSTIDFTTYSDVDLVYGYQRINRSRFPANLSACAAEISRRGLTAPTRFEIENASDDMGLGFMHKIGDGLTTLASTFTKRFPTTQA